MMVMYSNCQPMETGFVLRRQKDGSRMEVPCPTAIISYNQHMGGVDRGDQVRGYYSCRTRCRKFYKYIFHFLDVSITNAFILQKHFFYDQPFPACEGFPASACKGAYSRLLQSEKNRSCGWYHIFSPPTSLSVKDPS